MAFHLKQKAVGNSCSITDNIKIAPKGLHLAEHLQFKYLMWSFSCPWRCPAFHVLLASLLSDLVQGGAGLTGCCNSLLCPVIHQFVKIVGECASLVVAVVGLYPSELWNWLRRRWWRRCRGLRLTGGCLSPSGVERRPCKTQMCWKKTPQ